MLNLGLTPRLLMVLLLLVPLWLAVAWALGWWGGAGV